MQNKLVTVNAYYRKPYKMSLSDRWTIAWLYTRYYSKLTFAGVVVWAMLLAAFYIGTSRAHAQVDYVAVPSIGTSTPATIKDKVEDLKNKVLDEMNACENVHHLLTWNDDNKEHSLPMKDKPSNGDMAYKISTVEREYSTLYGKELNDHEALVLALDTPQARALAINAWVNIKGSINEWSCATDQMRTQVEDIRFLTQN